MGNENSTPQIELKKESGKGTNKIARSILENNVKGIPTDEQITVALAMQQSQDVGPLKKTDLIAILIRLNPDKNNALLTQYKKEDLVKCIRNELYTKPLYNKFETQKEYVKSYPKIQNNPDKNILRLK
jgi:hypothetical protein